MERDMLVAILLGVLVLVSAVQAVELANLKSDIETGQLSIGAKSTTNSLTTGSNTGSSASVPSNLQNLPDMVGGC